MALLDQGHFGAQLSTASVNTGIIRERPIPLGDTLVAGTAAQLAVNNNMPTIALTATTINFSFVVPFDYDDRPFNANDLYSGDYCRIRVLARGGASSTLALTSVVRCRGGVSTESTLTLSTAQTTAQTVVARVSGFSVLNYDISSLGLRAGDVLSITMTSAGANPTNVVGVSVMYRGHIVTTDSTDR